MLLRLVLFSLFFFLFQQNLSAADAGTVFGIGKIVPSLQNGGDDLVTTSDNIFGYIIGLFYFISIIFAIYAGFTILTSGGDEEKVKKGKQILIYVVIGLVVVFLASQIVTWVISIMSDSDIVGPATNSNP